MPLVKKRGDCGLDALSESSWVLIAKLMPPKSGTNDNTSL
jgi:hypothetical protein